MSFDFPQSVERDIERYASEQRISLDEALLRLVQTGLHVARPTPKSTAIIPEEIIEAFDRAYPALDQLSDISDQDWDRVLASAGSVAEKGISNVA